VKSSCWTNSGKYLHHHDGQIYQVEKGYTYRQCCASQYAPQGNDNCWDGENFTFLECCPLSLSNENEFGIPFFHHRQILIRPRQRSVSPEDAGDLMVIHQGGLEDGTNTFLWQTGYRLLRWFECYADLGWRKWRSARFIEFGPGTGVASLMAAVNGVSTIMGVDADLKYFSLNIQANMASNGQSDVRGCSLNWTWPLARSLRQLAECAGEQGDQLEQRWDILALAGSRHKALSLAPLMYAVAAPGAVLLVTEDDKLYYRTLYRAVAPMFEEVGWWLDTQPLVAWVSDRPPVLVMLRRREQPISWDSVRPSLSVATFQGSACSGEGYKGRW